MEYKQTNVEELFYKLKEYGDTRLDLFKLKAINKVSGFLGTLITSIILVCLLLLILVCISVGLSILIGSAIGSMAGGFFIMAAIYMIIGLVLFSTRTKILKTPISNKLIKDLID